MKVTEVVQEKHDRGLSYKVAVGVLTLGLEIEVLFEKKFINIPYTLRRLNKAE